MAMAMLDLEKKKWKSECKIILTALFNHEESGPFHEKVDYLALGLTDYPKVVKSPMDLGLIQQKLEKGMYKTPSEFASDVRLVWHNCKLYNQAGSDFHSLAVSLSEIFEEQFKEVTRSDVPGNPNTEFPSLDQKTLFTTRMFHLKSEDLLIVMNVLETACNKALNHITYDETDIIVDEIDNPTFWEIDTFMRMVLPDVLPPLKQKKKRAKPEGGSGKDSMPKQPKTKKAKGDGKKGRDDDSS